RTICAHRHDGQHDRPETEYRAREGNHLRIARPYLELRAGDDGLVLRLPRAPDPGPGWHPHLGRYPACNPPARPALGADWPDRNREYVEYCGRLGISAEGGRQDLRRRARADRK